MLCSEIVPELQEYVKYKDFMDYAGNEVKMSVQEECDSVPSYIKLAWFHEVYG